MSNEFVLDEKMSCDLVAYIRDNIAISELATANTQSIVDKFKQSHTPKEDNTKRDWEIMTYNHTRTGGISNVPSLHKDDPVEIHSVKRLSDNEVFSVGDEVGTKHQAKDKIKNFTIKGDEMFVHTDYDWSEIYWLTKLPAKPKEQPPQKEEHQNVLYRSEGGTKSWQQDKPVSTTFNRDKEQRIEVVAHEVCDMSHKVYAFSFNVPIKYKDKLSAIKQAIEQVLNQPEVTKEDLDRWLKEFQFYPATEDAYIGKYTQKQLDEYGEKCFKAGKEKEIIPQKVKEVMTAFYSEKYLSYEDFKNQNEKEA